MKLITDTKLLNRLSKENVVSQALLAQEMAASRGEALNAIEELLIKFADERFNSTGKPKKFLWWAILNADVVFNLIKEIITIIKNLKYKYDSDIQGSN